MSTPAVTIDANTPVFENGVLTAAAQQRPQLVRIAQHVFGRTETNAMSAFSQFRTNDQLARIIQAKRDGVFDYGAHIKSTPQGFSKPSADEALAMLDAAEKNEAPAQQAAPAQPVQRARAAPKAVTQPVQEVQQAPAVIAQVDIQGARGAIDLGQAILDKINSVQQDLGGAFAALDTRVLTALSEVRNDVRTLALGVRGTVGLFEVIMARQKVIAQYLDQYAELPEPGEDMMSDIAALAGILPMAAPRVPEMRQVQAAEPEAAPEETPVEDAPVMQTPRRGRPPKVQPTVEATPEQPAQVAQPEATDAGVQTVSYTTGDLEKIAKEQGIEALRSIAKQVGVPDADKIAFLPVLILRIMKQQA